MGQPRTDPAKTSTENRSTRTSSTVGSSRDASLNPSNSTNAGPSSSSSSLRLGMYATRGNVAALEQQLKEAERISSMPPPLPDEVASQEEDASREEDANSAPPALPYPEEDERTKLFKVRQAVRGTLRFPERYTCSPETLQETYTFNGHAVSLENRNEAFQFRGQSVENLQQNPKWQGCPELQHITESSDDEKHSLLALIQKSMNTEHCREELIVQWIDMVGKGFAKLSPEVEREMAKQEVKLRGTLECRSRPLIQYRSKRSPLDLDSIRALIEAFSGRQVYSSRTLQPVGMLSGARDSDDEDDQSWLKRSTINLLDDFTDVNVGEKAMMKMWNLLLLLRKFDCTGDVHFPHLFKYFVRQNTAAVVALNLLRNFTVMIGMFLQHGLLSQSDSLGAVAFVQGVSKTKLFWGRARVAGLQLVLQNLKEGLPKESPKDKEGGLGR